MNNMLTFEEVKSFLEIEQSELDKYLKQGKLKAYKIGGTYLRFRKEEVLNLRYEIQPKKAKSAQKVSFGAKLVEFWRFNNFYIVSILIVLSLIIFVART